MSGDLPLTIIDPELEKKVRRTRPGMAHWAGSGPEGAVCGHCIFWGYIAHGRQRTGKSCEKYYRLTGLHGGGLDKRQDGCKYFQKADPDRQRQEV